jgi:hypothetical protein
MLMRLKASRAVVEGWVTARRGFRRVNTARQETIDSSGLIARSLGSLAPLWFAHSDTPRSPVRRIRLTWPRLAIPLC